MIVEKRKEKYYWYYVFSFVTNAQLDNDFSVTTSLTKEFPLLEVRSKWLKKTRSNDDPVVIVSWNEISKETFQGLKKQAKKA